VHFTYEPPDKSELLQGDILKRTPQIEEMLQTVHPHYCKEDYCFLIVLTQSCDLVRRGGICKARYISLAAVRPLSLVFQRELEKAQRDPLERKGRFCDAAKKPQIKQFLERLFNNNEPEYFYLHDDPTTEVKNEPYCAFLKLSIAIKSDNHYDSCLDAKVLQLQEAFRHKLGWLVGNMYSRVDTEDWVPKAHTREEFDSMIDQVLEGTCIWINSEHRAKLLKSLKALDIENLQMEQVREQYEVIKKAAPKKKDILLDRLGEIMRELGAEPELIRKTKTRLQSDPEVATVIK
jgi:hypothetical protein